MGSCRRRFTQARRESGPASARRGTLVLLGGPLALTPRRSAFLIAVVLGMGLSAPSIRLAAAPALVVVVWRALLPLPLLGSLALARREPLTWHGAFAGAFLLCHWLSWT